jgi:antitoxin component YwqK of YwqJK toxin-antitoxin module
VKLPTGWLFALVLAAAGCRHETGLGQPPPGWRPPPPGELAVRRKVDKETGRVTREWSMLVFKDRPSQKHGTERTYYPSGRPQWEREYREGKPNGAWRSWYEDGNLRSESYFGDPARETQMSFWHPNGQLSMRGPARNGSRSGTWTFWYANGQKAEEGEFVGSMREGRWIAWTKDGTQRFERFYKKNVRVSETPIDLVDPAPSGEELEEPRTK